jgi:putative ABC transport system permease protein
MLIVLLGSGNGLENGVKSRFNDVSNNSVWIYTGQTTLPYKGLKKGRDIQFRNEDLVFAKNNISSLEHLSTQFHKWGQTKVYYKNKTGKFNILGTNEEFKEIAKTQVYKGRFINKLDLRDFRKVAVIGLHVEEALFGKTNPIGEYINLNNIPFKIVGVFKDEGNQDEQQMIMLPLTTAQKVFNGANNIENIIVSFKDISSGQKLKEIEKLKTGLALKHNFDVLDPKAIDVWNVEEEYLKMLSLFKGIRIFIWIIGIGTLLAGIVGISNIMMISVKERTREIGIRKALGAKPSSIVFLILLESVVITFIAGYFGLVSGVGLIELANIGLANVKMDASMFKNPTVDFTIAISATVLLIVAGALAGFFPARKAAQVSPIEALKSD